MKHAWRATCAHSNTRMHSEQKTCVLLSLSAQQTPNKIGPSRDKHTRGKSQHACWFPFMLSHKAFVYLPSPVGFSKSTAAQFFLWPHWCLNHEYLQVKIELDNLCSSNIILWIQLQFHCNAHWPFTYVYNHNWITGAACWQLKQRQTLQQNCSINLLSGPFTVN